MNIVAFAAPPQFDVVMDDVGLVSHWWMCRIEPIILTPPFPNMDGHLTFLSGFSVAPQVHRIGRKLRTDGASVRRSPSLVFPRVSPLKKSQPASISHHQPQRQPTIRSIESYSHIVAREGPPLVISSHIHTSQKVHGAVVEER